MGKRRKKVWRTSESMTAYAARWDEERYCCPRCFERDQKVLTVDTTDQFAVFRFVAKCNKDGTVFEYTKRL